MSAIVECLLCAYRIAATPSLTNIVYYNANTNFVIDKAKVDKNKNRVKYLK